MLECHVKISCAAFCADADGPLSSAQGSLKKKIVQKGFGSTMEPHSHSKFSCHCTLHWSEVLGTLPLGISLLICPSSFAVTMCHFFVHTEVFFLYPDFKQNLGDI